MTWRCLVHAFIECRTRTDGWWLYARPNLPPDEAMADLLVGTEVDGGEPAVHSLGVPSDASLAVRDEFTWRVAGPAGGEAPNIVSVEEAERWMGRGASTRWPTREPFMRVVDPRWSHATWLEAEELAWVLDHYETTTGQPAPATYCALLAMMEELQRDYVVRVVLWLERRHASAWAPIEAVGALAHDHQGELERARTQARLRPRHVRRAGMG